MHKTSCGSALPLPPLSHHSERVEGRAGHHPGLPQARRKAGQAPPPQQLPKVVGVAREAEEACKGASGAVRQVRSFWRWAKLWSSERIGEAPRGREGGQCRLEAQRKPPGETTYPQYIAKSMRDGWGDCMFHTTGISITSV